MNSNSFWFKSFISILLLSLSMAGKAQNGQNVLFISVDDLRPELNCYGSTHMHTPNIDQLATQGMLFSNAYSQQAICTPSRISMLTGLRPSTTNIYKLDNKLKDKAPNVVSMPKAFKNHGYKTISLGKIYHHQNDDPDAWTEKAWRPRNGVDGTWYNQGYLNESPFYVTSDGKSFGPPTESMDVADNAYQDGVTAERAIEKLEQYKDQQFFLAVGFKKPHLPFLAPKKYWDLYDRNNIDLPLADEPEGLGKYSTTNWGELRSYLGMPETADLNDEQTKELIHGYRACVSYIDAQIGKIIDKLNELGLRENTIIVLWSDHGFKLGEYGDWCKHTNFEVDVRVPFILDVPGVPNGITCSKMVESVDIFPTLAELLSVQAPSNLDGKSMKPLLENPGGPWKSAAFSQYPRWASFMGNTVRTKNYRYTEYIDESNGEVNSSELYRHDNNTPLELDSINLIPLIEEENNYESIRDRMKNLLCAGWERVRQGTSIEIKESSSTSVTLKIYNVSEATSIKLLMKEGNGSYTEIMPGAIKLSTTELTIPNLTAGKTYDFKLELVGDNYNGGYSNVVTTQLNNKISLITNGNFSSGKDASWQYNSNNSSEVNYSLISQGNDNEVLLAQVSAFGNNFWDVGIINKQQNTFSSEVVHISFYAKSSVSDSKIRCGMQSRTSPSITKYQSVTIGTDWEKHELDIDITADRRTDWQFKLFFETIADFTVDSLEATITATDSTSLTEQWETEADQRIQNLRKGDFTIQFIGSNGSPIQVKEASIKMVKHQFPFGSVMKLDDNASWSTALMKKYFNTSVVSNEFKWSGMQRNEGPVDYSKVNEYLDWADSYNIPMKGHVLIWGGTGDNDGSDYHKIPRWVREKPDGTPRTENEIEALCKTRVQETINYYKDRIPVFDVLNEPTTNHADWLQRKVGTDINWKVFKWARESSTEAQLLINDYGILASGSTNASSKVYEYAQLIKTIQANAPGAVTAVGCQGHFSAAIPSKFYDNLSYLYNQTGLPIHITEFDLNVDKYGVSETQQAEEYYKALKLAFSHPNVDAFVFWGFYDSNHWRDGAGMFNEDKTPKEAAGAVYDLIYQEWATNDTLVTNAEGKINISAFYGSYEIEIEDNGVKKMIEVGLTSSNEDNVIVLDLVNSSPTRPRVTSATAISANQLQLKFSKEMDITSLDISSFILHSSDEIPVTGIQLANDGLSAILETGSPLNEKSFTTISYIKNDVTSIDGGELAFFGLKEIGFNNNSTSINEIAGTKKNKIRVYQNSNKTQYKVFSEEQIQKISIYDINGRLILKEQNIDNATYSFSANNFPRGVLIVVVNDINVCKFINY